MSLVPSQEFAATLRLVFSEVAISELIDPELQRHLGIYIDGSHDPITEDTVKNVLGNDAAEKWRALRVAIAAFRRAAKTEGGE